MGEKAFIVTALDLENEIFVVYVTSLSSTSLNIHLFCKSRIFSLIAKKAFTKVPNEYVNFANMNPSALAFKLLKYTRMNGNAIKLVDGQQSPYGSIYSLGPVKLETLKAYIETSLVNEFTKPSKSLVDAPILFD